MATVIIPTPLRKFTNNQARFQVQAADVVGSIQEITREYPALQKHLLDEKGNIRSFVNIFLGEDDIRNLEQEKTRVHEGSVISIIPAIAGGMQA